MSPAPFAPNSWLALKAKSWKNDSKWVAYSSLAGNSHTTNNLLRSVRRKLPPSVPRVNLLKPSRGISHNKQPPQISLAQITPLCAQGYLLQPSRDIFTTDNFSTSVWCQLPPCVPRVTCSSLAWTSHTTGNLPRSFWRKLPLFVPRVAYSSLAGNSHTTNNLLRLVRRKLPPSVPRDNLLKTSRGIPHNQQPPQISPAQMTPNEAKIEKAAADGRSHRISCIFSGILKGFEI